MSSASRIVGASAGSSRRACDGRSRSTGRPSAAAERGEAVERLGLVAVARDDERADRAVAGVAPSSRAERRVAARALAARARAARARRTRPRRPARACPAATCQRAGLARVDHDRRARRAAARATRRRGRSRRRRRRRRRSSLTALALRLRPPYAGTTRIRFDGRRPGGALSARLRAPVFWRSWYPLVGDATRAPRHRPPVPRLPRAAARVDRGGGARRRRSRPAARQVAGRRRRSSRRRARVPRPRRALHPQRPARPGRGVRRRRRARRPGRPAAGRGARARRAGPDRRPLHPRAGAGRRRATPTPTSTTSPSARCTRRRPSRAAPPRAWTTSRTRRRAWRKPWFAIGGLDAGNVARGRRARRDADRRGARDHRGRGPRGRGPRAARRAVTHHDVPRRHAGADAELYTASADAPARRHARAATRARAPRPRRSAPGSSRSARTSARSASSSRPRSRVFLARRQPRRARRSARAASRRRVGLVYAVLMARAGRRPVGAPLPRDRALPGAAGALDHRLRALARLRQQPRSASLLALAVDRRLLADLLAARPRDGAPAGAARVNACAGDRRDRGGVRGGRREHDRRLAAR